VVAMELLISTFPGKSSVTDVAHVAGSRAEILFPEGVFETGMKTMA